MPLQVSHLLFPFIFPFQGSLKVFGWAWERDLAFDSKVIQAGTNRWRLRWVDWRGNPVPVSSEVTANSQFRATVLKVSRGEALGDVGDLLLRDPEHFRAGELHEHVDSWKEIVTRDPTFHQSEVLSWIEGKVSVSPFFQHFSGVFKGESYDSDLPPGYAFLNNVSCKLFVKFIQQTLLDRLETGAVSLLGWVRSNPPPPSRSPSDRGTN